MSGNIAVNEKSKFSVPLVWMVAIVAFLVSAGAAGAVVQSQVSDHGDRLSKVEAKVGTVELRQERSDTNYLHILNTLDRVEKKIDRMDRRRTEDVP